MAQTIAVLGASLAAADLSILAGKIQITGAPAIDTKLPGAQTIGLEKYIVGLGLSTRIDFVVANNTTYSFNLVSNLPSNGRFGAITCGASYTSDSTASATEIRTGLKASLEGSAAAAGLNITVTDPGSTNTYITVTGGFATTTLRDFSAYQVGTISNVTVGTGTSDGMYMAPDSTPSTAFIFASATITTASAHGLEPGNVVFFKGWASSVVTFRGATASSATGIVTRVLSVTNATAFVLDGVTATTANTGTIEVYKVATQPMGTPAAVQAELNALYLADGTALAPTVNTAYNYSRVAFTAYTPNPGLPGVLSTQDIVIYYAAAGVSTPWTTTTSSGAFQTALINALNGGGGTANPALLEASSGTLY